jgi:hypothetical protein
VMHLLEMPDPLASPDVQRHARIGE